MSELAELVSDVLSGNSFKTIELKNNKYYTVYAPTTLVVARMLKPLSKIRIDEEATPLSTVKLIGEQGEYIAEVLALAILGDFSTSSLKYKFSFWRLKRTIRNNNITVLLNALQDVISLIDAQSFFDCAQLAMVITKRMAKQESLEETH